MPKQHDTPEETPTAKHAGQKPVKWQKPLWGCEERPPAPDLCDLAHQFAWRDRRVFLGHAVAPGDQKRPTLRAALAHDPVTDKEASLAHAKNELAGLHLRKTAGL